MKKIFLVTHPEASHTVQNKVGGWYDSELTDRGHQDAARLRHKLMTHGAHLESLNVYSSDLRRCQQTSSAIMGSKVSRVQLDSRLREMSFGAHEGIDQREHAKAMQATPADGNRLDHKICPGAESRRDVAQRVRSLIDEIMLKEGDALIVTHGFAATFVVCAFQNIPEAYMDYVAFDFSPGSLSVLVEDDLFNNRAVHLLNA